MISPRTMVHWRSRESDNILKGYKLDIQVIVNVIFHQASSSYHQIIIKLSPNYHQLITKLSSNNHQIITKLSSNNHQIITKLSSTDIFSDDDWIKGSSFNPQLGVQIHALQKGIYHDIISFVYAPQKGIMFDSMGSYHGFIQEAGL